MECEGCHNQSETKESIEGLFGIYKCKTHTIMVLIVRCTVTLITLIYFFMYYYCKCFYLRYFLSAFYSVDDSTAGLFTLCSGLEKIFTDNKEHILHKDKVVGTLMMQFEGKTVSFLLM